MKYTKLAGINFEEHNSRNFSVAPITGCNRNEIFERYSRPSQTKVYIWNKWCNWCDDMNNLGYSCGIQIECYNCHTITITGSVRKDGEVIGLRITPGYNRMYRHYPI